MLWKGHLRGGTILVEGAMGPLWAYGRQEGSVTYVWGKMTAATPPASISVYPFFNLFIQKLQH
jgi:hypothetical protein